MKRLIIPGLIFFSFLLSGCQATHMIYVHESSLGVVLTPFSTEGTSKFSFGFDRETYALIPKIKEGGANADAMLLAGASRVKVKGLSELKFGHVIATGEAAANLGESGEVLRQAQELLKTEQERSQ